jgi:hypothetical protein
MSLPALAEEIIRAMTVSNIIAAIIRKLGEIGITTSASRAIG